MSLHNLCILATALLTFVATGCRTSAHSEVLDAGDQPATVETATAGDTPPAAPIDCGEVSPISSDAMRGDALFDLTSRCVFDRDVHQVRIRILSETFQKVLDDGCASRDSGFGHVLELVFDGKKIQNVGIKVRGNTSKCNSKRQFKFKFDVKEIFSVWQGVKEMKQFPGNDGRTFFGLEGFSVRTSGNDPSMIRERVSSRLFANAESLVPTAQRGGLVYRVAFTKFLVSFGRTASEGPEGPFTRLIDGFYYDYKGFYSLAENIDKTFLRSRFQVNDQKLKGFYLYQSDLAAAYFDRAHYTRKGWSQEYVDGKKTEEEADIAAGESKLFELFDLLASGADDATLEKAIDVENVVNYVAAAILAGHWDSMLANRNNDLLFFNGAKKKWQIITWDTDNTQGALIDQYHALMSNKIYSPARDNESKLFTELFAESRPVFRAKLAKRLEDFIDGFSSEAKFNPMIDELKGRVQSSLEGWEGFNPQAFEDIKNFAKARRDSVRSQL